MKSAMSSLVVTLLFAFASIASAAPALDAQGKCRDNGKVVKAELCAGQKKAATHCRDITTKKFAKCGAPNTEPVPGSSAK